MSTPTTGLLLSRTSSDLEDEEVNQSTRDHREDVPGDLEDETEILGPDAPIRKRDPLRILITYGLACSLSFLGLCVALAGYIMTVKSPFDKQSKKQHRAGYESNFLGMQSIVVLLFINTLWTAFNFTLALKGHQDRHELIWLLNMLYDFLAWPSLIGFGVLNMVEMLWDRRMCDGWGGDEKMYAKCDKAMFALLVIELVAVNLGILVAVIHFILLVGRCCMCGRRDAAHRFHDLRRRIVREEEILMTLMERRRRLMTENEELEARRLMFDPVAETSGTADDDGSNQLQPCRTLEDVAVENLIDVTSSEGRE